MPREVVITGCGPVCALGIGRDAFREALRAGEAGIAEITAFEVPADGPQLAAEVVELDVKQYLRSAKNYLDRNSELAFAACELALRDAGLDLGQLDLTRVGLATGTQWGNTQTFDAFRRVVVEKGPRFAPPFIFPHAYANTTNSLLSIEYGVQGYNQNFTGFATSGAEAVVCAWENIRAGRADVMIAGGMEALSAPLFAAYAAAPQRLSRATDGRPEGCRPLAPDRNGAVLGEGAAFLVLEAAESAAARGARVMARIVDAARGRFPLGVFRSVRERCAACTRTTAVFSPASGFIGDTSAEVFLPQVFGERGVPVTAVKSLIGETMGASGPLALAAALDALELGVIPRTAGSASCALPEVDLCLEPRSLESGAVIVSTTDLFTPCIAVALAR